MQGTVTPDEFFIFKPTLRQNKKAIIQKKLGEKAQTMIYAEKGTEHSTLNIKTPVEKREQFVLNDDEIIQLAKWFLVIE